MNQAHMPPMPAHRIAKEYLGRSVVWFRQHRAELEAAGFPKPLPVTGLYDPAHVLAWRQAQFKMTASQASTADLAGLHNDGESEPGKAAGGHD